MDVWGGGGEGRGIFLTKKCGGRMIDIEERNFLKKIINKKQFWKKNYQIQRFC